ncbi:hypothetical protein ACG7TL_000853 [Trametes sanguinea]
MRTIAFKTLPRQQFGNLQHRTFPIYFVLSIALSSSLLGLWVYSHPSVLQNYLHPTQGDVAQAYALAAVVLSQASNHAIIGPLTSKWVLYMEVEASLETESICLSRTMFKRHKLEKEEGKAYNEPNVSTLFDFPYSMVADSAVRKVSAEMKALNKLFAQLHGISSLANLTAFLALLFHGLWIGNTGAGIKSVL